MQFLYNVFRGRGFYTRGEFVYFKSTFDSCPQARLTLNSVGKPTLCRLGLAALEPGCKKNNEYGFLGREINCAKSIPPSPGD